MRIVALLSILVAGPALSEEIRCEGAFGPDSSEARLVETFGRENVVTGDVPGPEGSTVLATTVFPNDPARTMEFGWWDEEQHQGTAYFTVARSDVAPGGLKPGMSVSEVEVLNGGPFEMYGFFWDYGGTAGFEGGRLGDLDGGCTMSAVFTLGDYAEGLDVEPISGDRLIWSTEPLLEKVGARVESITVGYPDESAVDD